MMYNEILELYLCKLDQSLQCLLKELLYYEFITRLLTYS